MDTTKLHTRKTSLQQRNELSSGQVARGGAERVAPSAWLAQHAQPPLSAHAARTATRLERTRSAFICVFSSCSSVSSRARSASSKDSTDVGMETVFDSSSSVRWRAGRLVCFGGGPPSPPLFTKRSIFGGAANSKSASDVVAAWS